MYTADDANGDWEYELDQRIRSAVREQDAGYKAAYLRIYCEDPFRWTIQEELEKRGFHSVRVPDIVIKGDVYFSWCPTGEYPDD